MISGKYYETINIDLYQEEVIYILVQYKKEANKWLLLGFIVWFAGNILRGGLFGESEMYSLLGSVVFIIGFLMFLYGCINYTKAKGYGWIVGLLGLFNLLGLIVLVLLPDKNKNEL